MIRTETVMPGVVEIVLARPEKRNALCMELLEKLWSAVRAAEQEPTHRVLVLSGDGPVFCAGLDLDEARDRTHAAHSAELIAELLTAVHSSRLVVIAAVHGAALAGGAGLMSACDFAICGAETKLGYPEVHRGLIPALVLTFLRRQLRERDVRRLVLTGAPVTAAEALQMGLISQVVATGEPRAAALALAREILRGAPQAVAASKRLIDELWPRTVRDDLHRAHRHHLQARDSAEAQEGMLAFLEKRRPNWIQD